MELFIGVMLGLFTAVLIANSLFVYQLVNKFDIVQPSMYEDYVEQEVVQGTDDYLTDYEKHQLRKKEEFARRISKIKDELADEGVARRSTGLIAEELHPRVRNLPHDVVEFDKRVLDVEYSD